jgi:threonine aldolase
MFQDLSRTLPSDVISLYYICSLYNFLIVEVNIISDTVTKPNKKMLEAMISAPLGDDVFGEDPTVNALEEKVQKMFGKEAAIFCPSGTMTNQLAIKLHTKSLDEMICDVDSHVYQAESAGFAFHSGISVHLLQGQYGKITADQVESAIKPGHDWQPISRLVVLENSCNKGGGSYYTTSEIKPVKAVAKKHNLKMHLDGARLFNVLVETGESTESFGALFDSISICLSKGLGAPVGSVLTGNKEFVKEARRFRKVFGGGMRQAGILAAAGIYALDHHIHDLKTDNDRAKFIGEILKTKSFVKSLKPVFTNIIIFTLEDSFPMESFLKNLAEKGILATSFGHQTIRFVLHRDVTVQQFEYLTDVIKKL